MKHTTIAAAAAARAEGMAALADRPKQRRCTPAESASAFVTVRAQDVTLRAAGDDGGFLVFDGHASVYESPYEMYDFFGPYTEVVSRGAGAKSLNRSDLDVPFVLAHDSLRRMARTTNGTLQLSEDEVGLHVLAPQLDPTDVDVAYIAPKLRAGLIDEMSFAFRITRGMWSPDYTEFRIDEFDIHRGDVAIVGYGANPATSGTLRSKSPEEIARALDDTAARRLLDVLHARLAPEPPTTRTAALITEADVRLMPTL